MLLQVLVNSVAVASGYVLVATGFSLIYSTARFFHFAHGAAYTFGAYMAYAVAASTRLGWWGGLAAGVVSAGLLGSAIDMLVYRRLRKSQASATILLLASTGILILVQNVIALTFGDGTLELRRPGGDVVHEFLGAIVTRAQLERMLVAILMIGLVWSILRFSQIGRMIRATASDPFLADVVGIRKDRVHRAAFAMGSGLAGLAAVLMAHDTDLRPGMGFRALFVAVVAVVLGGVGSTGGIVLGGLLIALLQNLSIWIWPAQWGDAISYTVMIGFLLLRPRGFFGRTIPRQGVST